MPLYLTDDRLDKCNALYQDEFARWAVRRTPSTGKWDRFALIRNTSPNNDIIDESYQEITTLTARQCHDKHAAEGWLNTYRGRAAMRAALGDN